MNAQHLVNPYPGLRPFEQEDSDFFFGREPHTEELLRRLGDCRFVAVVGTSGSGKSSLVRAGLIPSLYGDQMAAGSHWRIAIFRPGDDPIQALTDVLDETILNTATSQDGTFHRGMLETTLRRSSLGLVEAIKQSQIQERENVLLVVDQFEELFRFQDRAATSEAKDESVAFVRLLLEGASNPSQPVYVLITMRSDFLGDCARFRDLPEAVNRGIYLVPRLTRDQLRGAIEAPAAVAGCKIAPSLVERLLNEIGDDQDQLPVLQHALMRTWRPNGAMDLQEYETTGGMEKALSQHADEALERFSTPEQMEVVRKVFQCITEKGPDKREVRRPTRFGDIRAICGGASESQIKEVVAWFRAPGRSFLMPPDPTPISDETFIDIAHESLIRKWESLKEWVDEEAEFADTYRRLASSAELHGKGREGLWRDPGLQLALEQKEKGKWNEIWGARYAPNYTEALDFLEKSRLAREAEIFEKEKQRRQQLKYARAIAAVLAVAFIAALALVVYAYKQKSAAENQSKFSRQLLYVANMNLAGKAFDVADLSRGHEILNSYLPTAATVRQDDARDFYWYLLWRSNHQELATLQGHGARVNSVAFSNDGKALASASYDGTMTLWDVGSRQELATLKGHGTFVTSVAFSNDGKTLASAAWDRTVKLWDVGSRQELATLKGHGDIVSSVAFSNDGKTLASASLDKTVKLWDVVTRQELATLKGHGDSVYSVAFSNDGKTLASASEDKTVKLWDVGSRQELATLKGHGDSVYSVAFSNDGRTLASGSSDRTVKVWDVVSRQELATLKGHGDTVISVAFSNDGITLASASVDKTVKLWVIGSRQELATLKGHGNIVISVAFSNDGKTLASASADKTVKLWDVSSWQELATLRGHGDTGFSVAFSSDGKTLASASVDKTVKLWDVGSRRELATLKGHGDGVSSVAFSNDGRTLASASADKTVKLWDVVTRQELATLRGHGSEVSSVTFSNDGKTLASASGDKTVKLWDVGSRRELATLEGHGDGVSSVAISNDGKTLASASADKTVKLWDVVTRQELATLKGHGDAVFWVAFSNDGKTLASASADKTVKLWDVSSRQELATLRGHEREVSSVAFSNDGKTLASASWDKTVKLWDVVTRQELATLKGHGDIVNSVAFSNDGKTLASASYDKTIRFWEAATDKQVAAQR